MQLKRLKEQQDSLQKPLDSTNLPVISWESCTQGIFLVLEHLAHKLYVAVLISVEVVQDQAKHRHLLLVSGFIHDIGTFLDDHPGGRPIVESMVGKDSTAAFFGGVYDHSNAAHNVS